MNSSKMSTVLTRLSPLLTTVAKRSTNRAMSKCLSVTGSEQQRRSLQTPKASSFKEQSSSHEIKTLEKQESIEFRNTFEAVKKSLTLKVDPQLSEIYEWYDKVIEYNVPHGKLNRGLAVVMTYRIMVTEEEQTPRNLLLARIMGWCTELFQAYCLVQDDVMDQSTTRRGQLCWYRQDGVGLIALNDSNFLLASVFQLLHMFFKDKPYYLDCLHLFNEVNRFTIYGQTQDMLTTPPGKKPNFSFLTMDRYLTIVKYKTAYYSLSLPIRLGLYMAGVHSKEFHEEVESIMLKMGIYFQIQDDYLDCFGDSEKTGKIGTDIEEGKCSWVVVNALERASQDQTEVLMANYGIRQADSVKQVKKLYNELKLKEVYNEYEVNICKEIGDDIERVSSKIGIPSTVFNSVLAKIRGRTK